MAAAAESKQKDFIFDSATLYYGDIDISKPDDILTTLVDKKLGVSYGSVSLKVGQELYNCPVQHSNEKNIAGYQRVIRVEGEIEAEIIVADKKLLQMSLFENITEGFTSTKFDKWAPKLGEIPLSMYKTLLMVAKKGAEDWIIIFNKTYNSNGLEIETKDGEDAVAKVTFAAAYDPDNFEKPPIEIFLPKAVVAGP